MENRNRSISEDVNTDQELKRKTPVFLISLVVIVLLATAAFIGGNLLYKQSSESNDGVEFALAEGVPEEDPVLIGMVTKTDGDILIVQEFNINDTLGVSGTGGVVISEPIFIEGDPVNAENGDPIVPDFFGGSEELQTEIIINQDTIIYKDITEILAISSVGVGNGDVPDMQDMPDMPDKIEQKIELGSIEEIGNTSFVTVWGEKKGDRVYATVIIYQPPVSFSIPSN